MNKAQVIKVTAEYARNKMAGEGSGHDWWHVFRVWQTAKTIAANENADMFIVELAALLHDIADWKFNDGDTSVGSKISGEWLTTQGVASNTIKIIQGIIENISFKGAGVLKKIGSKEGEIVQDADRLDAIGAIGIGRTFTYGGFTHKEMYNPDIKVQMAGSFEEYRSAGQTTINHFYEKLLLLKDLMNTETGKQMAEKRHQYMEQFLDEFFSEWKGLS